MKKNLFKLFLLAAVLIVGVGEMWGTYYNKGTAVVVCEAGASGVVSVGPSIAYDVMLESTSIEWSASSYTATVAGGTSRWVTYYVYYYAKPSPDSYFVGWYSDEACTIKVSSDLITSKGQKKGGTTPETANDKGSLYAKFAKEPSCIYLGLSAESDNATMGLVQANVNASIDPTFGKYYGNLAETHAIACSGEFVNEGEYADAEATLTQRVYAGAMVPRGYKFVRWNIQSPTNTSLVEGYSLADYRSAFDVSTTKENIITSGTSIIYGKVKAYFEETTSTTLTIRKKSGLGTITGKYTYLNMNGNGSLSEADDFNFDLMDAATTEAVYDNLYPFDKITLTAAPSSGAAFRGWYKEVGDDRELITENPKLTLRIGENDVYYAHFSSYTEDEKFLVNGITYNNFADALAVAPVSESKVILQLSNYTIPAGTYTIPAGVTLLVPHSGAQEEPSPSINRTAIEGNPTGAYCTLTLDAGVHLNVYGTIEVSGKLTAGSEDSGAEVGISRTSGPTYGQMIMNSGSSITLNNGAEFRAWGYVTGSGEIDARRGAVVKEPFQIMDWKGLSYTQSMFHSPNDVYKVLPVNQYYIQNVEVPVTYRPGSKLLASAAVHVSLGIIAMNDVGIIGVDYSNGNKDKALFLMNNEDDSEDTWVRKSYNPTIDQQLYEANNAASLGSLVMSVYIPLFGQVTMDSREYKLPLTNNFKIHLLSGEMNITQDTEILPGAEIEVNKKSTLTIDQGQTVWFWDSDNWGKYVSARMNDTRTDYIFDYASSVKYRPGGTPTIRTLTPEGLGDAKLTAHGTVNVKGYLKTTEAGAAITSTIDDAGTILFTNAAPSINANDKVWQATGLTPNPTYVGVQCVSGMLTNEAGSVMGNFSQTAGTAAGKSYHFIDIDGDGSGEWVNLTEDECFVYDQSGVYYIKPQAYVPISSGKPAEEADHTYRDHYAGTNKIYIEAGCQWWEVTATATPGIFHCEHPDNNTYYYYDEDDGAWVEKKFNIYWLNYNGDTLKFTDKNNVQQDHYELPYNSHPQWLSDNPTRPANANYSYSFNGWKPAITAETRVTDSVTYVAQYTEVPRQFIITFKNASGVEIETSIYSYLATPVAPTGEGINLETHQWSPAISAVTGNQVYQLIEKPGTFTVTYKDWDGTVLQTTSEITSGATTPSCEEPSRAADALYNYTFKEWSPAVAATVTADAVYTATYNRASKNFTVRFFKEGTTNETKEVEGNLLSTQSVAYGAMPTPPAATKTSPADHTVYTLVWSPLVAAATGDQDYIATFTEAPEQFTVTWKNGTQTLAVDHVDYNAPAQYSGILPTSEDDDSIYPFTGWSPAPAAHVTENVTYTAQFGAGHAKSVTVGTSDSYATAGHVETLILKASETASGQITANVTATNAYFDLTINATTELATGATRQWHAFGVPWQVNLDTDPIQEVGGSNRTFVLGRDYDIIYYNGAKRAASGAGYWCWEFLENHLHLLQPGQGYMIAFAPSIGEVGTIRFAKKNLAPVIFNGTMTVDANTGAVANNSGWNAIANPKACKVTLNAGPTTGYVYNPATDNYSAFNIENRDYIVGKVVYIQANGSQSVVINNASGNPFVAAAPARRTEVADKEYLSLDDYYQVAIASTTTEGGHVYVLPEEDKENKYVIGHDLAQFGMSAAIPQVWVNRYDTKLALNTTALFNETAEFPMGVYAPTAGEYTISLNAQPSDEYNVYLTRDGQAIWNLSDGAFTTDLKAGIQSNYGLRLTVNKAPQVVTGIDEAIVDAKGETKKVLINNQVFIIRGEQVYSIDGQIVK